MQCGGVLREAAPALNLVLPCDSHEACREALCVRVNCPICSVPTVNGEPDQDNFAALDSLYMRAKLRKNDEHQKKGTHYFCSMYDEQFRMPEPNLFVCVHVLGVVVKLYPPTSICTIMRICL